MLLLPMVGEEGFGGKGLWAAVANIRKIGEVFVLGVMVGPYLKQTGFYQWTPKKITKPFRFGAMNSIY